MQTLADTTVIDMVDHAEMLLLFQDYVAEAIEESTPASPSRPLGFDDWRREIFNGGIEEHTTVITVTLTWETASHGYLCGSNSQDYRIRIPGYMVTETGGIVDEVGLKRIGAKFAHRMNLRLPSVVYRGERVYHWTWD
jgi:hypothetical protein